MHLRVHARRTLHPVRDAAHLQLRPLGEVQIVLAEHRDVGMDVGRVALDVALLDRRPHRDQRRLDLFRITLPSDAVLSAQRSVHAE
jgi:hypothetical protein